MVSGIRGEEMAKIIYVPLDERPCNLVFPQDLFNQKDIQIIVPPDDLLPYKTKSADVDGLFEFLLKESKNADGLVVSMDMLLYGGLVPSRIHELSTETIKERHELIKELKKQNPKLQIYAFQIIMRCPQYNGADEEPLYYKDYGRNIFLTGYYEHKMKLGRLSAEEKANYESLVVPAEHLNNFVSRRQKNLSFNLLSLNLVKDNAIDFMIMCQDDASEFGYPAMDQAVVTTAIKESHLSLKVYAYSGADELGVIMVSRMVNRLKGKTPKFYLKYPSPTTPMVVPCLEDRALDNSVKYQIISAGGIIVSSLAEADICILILMGATKMFPRVVKNDREIDVLVNLIEAFEFIKFASKTHPVVIADLFYLNAGSTEVLNLIKESGLLMDVAAYAGWNTAANAFGTAVAQGIAYFLFGNTDAHIRFLIKRYIEDVGYCGVVRSSVSKKIESIGFDYFHAGEKRGVVAYMVKDELLDFIDEYLSEIKNKFNLINVELPWKRMFEVGFDIELKD